MVKLINNHKILTFKLYKMMLNKIYKNLIKVGVLSKKYTLWNLWKYKYRQEVLFQRLSKPKDNLQAYKSDKK